MIDAGFFRPLDTRVTLSRIVRYLPNYHWQAHHHRLRPPLAPTAYARNGGASLPSVSVLGSRQVVDQLDELRLTARLGNVAAVLAVHDEERHALHVIESRSAIPGP